MPWGDGTGPWWAQGRWRCRKPGFGRGFGMGQGYGRGYGARMSMDRETIPRESQDSEMARLEAYASELETEFNEVKRRIRELKR